MKAIGNFLLAVGLIAAAIATWALAGIVGGILLTGLGIYALFKILQEESRG